MPSFRAVTHSLFALLLVRHQRRKVSPLIPAPNKRRRVSVCSIDTAVFTYIEVHIRISRCMQAFRAHTKHEHTQTHLTRSLGGTRHQPVPYACLDLAVKSSKMTGEDPEEAESGDGNMPPTPGVTKDEREQMRRVLCQVVDRICNHACLFLCARKRLDYYLHVLAITIPSLCTGEKVFRYAALIGGKVLVEGAG